MSSAALETSKPFSLDSTQENAIDELINRDGTLLIGPPGAGKSAVVAQAIDELTFQPGPLHKVLVLAPKRVAETVWPDEIATWTQDLPCVLLKSGESKDVRAAKWRTIHSEPRCVVVVGFELAAQPDMALALLAGGFDGLVVDESSRVAATGNRLVKRFRRAIGEFKWRVVMNGTPVTEGLEDIFGQMLFVDNGATFGRNRTKFLDRYFRTGWDGHSLTPLPGTEAEIAMKVKGSTVLLPRDISLLPELSIEPTWVEVPAATRKVYGRLARTGELADLDIPNAGVLRAKLLQLANGFVYTGDADTGDVLEYDRHKMDVAEKLWTATDQPHHMRLHAWDVQQDDRANRSMWHRSINGKGAIESWNRGEVLRLDAHPRSCGHGLNLQAGGATQIWYQPVDSAALWTQTICRLWRRGQAATRVRVHVLLAAGTVEEGMWTAREHKEAREHAFQGRIASD